MQINNANTQLFMFMKREHTYECLDIKEQYMRLWIFGVCAQALDHERQCSTLLLIASILISGMVKLL
jgi:hypothetical protein